VRVTNTGAVASDVSALAFVSTGAPGDPARALFDYAKVALLAPGASATMVFSLPPAAAASVGADGARVLRAGRRAVAIGDVVRAGEREAGRVVRAVLEVTGGEALVEAPPGARRG